MKTERNKAMENKEPTCADKLKLPLILDLIGPFLVHLQKPNNKHATIYAPLCENHHANLLTDEEDISLDEVGCCYTLHNPVPSTCFSQCDPDRPRELIRVKCSDPLNARGNYHLKMTVPLPNKIVSLRPEQVWIHKNTSNTWLTSGCQGDNPALNGTPGHDPQNIVNSARARGLRFIYHECKGCPRVTEDTGAEPPVGLDQLCAVTRGIGGVITPHYSLTLRFAAIHSASEYADSEDAYADAYSCFEHLRDLVPELPYWRVDFNNSSGSSPLLDFTGPNPHDCLSPNVIVQNHDDSDLA
jgi:hypothetical protein